MSASIPKAFEERGAGRSRWPMWSMQVGRSLFMLWALKQPRRRQLPQLPAHHRSGTPRRRCSGSPAPWPTARPGWRCGRVAVGIETVAPIVGFYVPGLGRSATTDWEVEGGHMAERCALFVIIALGESVLVTGATFAGLAWTAEHIGAFLVAFAGSVAMWVIYFNIGAERGEPPDRLVRRSRPAGAQRLHLSAHPDRGRHHRRRGRRRTGAASSRRPQRDRAPPRCCSAARRSISLGNVLFKRLSAPNLPAVASGRAWTAGAADPGGAGHDAAAAVGGHDGGADRRGGVGVDLAAAFTAGPSAGPDVRESRVQRARHAGPRHRILRAAVRGTDEITSADPDPAGCGSPRKATAARSPFDEASRRRTRLDDRVAIRRRRDRLRRHRQHLAVPSLSSWRSGCRRSAFLAARADQDRRAGIAADAAAGVQHQPPAADLLAQLAIAVGGHARRRDPADSPPASPWCRSAQRRGGAAAARCRPAASR